MVVHGFSAARRLSGCAQPHGGKPVVARIDRKPKYRPSAQFLRWNLFVIHGGVPYSVAPTVEPDVWQWQFQIGDDVKTGKTRTRLAAMAARRVQSKIDAALKEADAAPVGEDNDGVDAP